MENNKLTLSKSEKHLLQFDVLAQMLGKDWLKKEYEKPPRLQNLITVWIAHQDNDFVGNWLQSWIKDLAAAA